MLGYEDYLNAETTWGARDYEAYVRVWCGVLVDHSVFKTRFSAVALALCAQLSRQV